MILIISEDIDFTTNDVIDYFLFYKEDYHKLNSNIGYLITSFIVNNYDWNIDTTTINFNKVIKVWHRRGKFNFKFNTYYLNLNKYLKTDEKVLLYAIENLLKSDVEYIGSYKKEIENNKLEVLVTAKNTGLQIPNTLITSSKKELQKFYNSCDVIITKDLHHPVWFKIESTQYSSVGTIKVTQEMIDKCNEYFIPMFLQEMVDKKYEIRVFHYKNKLYPMAIFSQNDKQTAVDYRNYNDEKPNRNVPVLIPKKLETKIFALLNDLDLNTCSIDFIVSTDNEYVFLEVNPMGQLDWVSKNCNYYIEKFIAEDLMA